MKFIDLFCGIGGFHYAMQLIDTTAQCVFAVDIDERASKIYQKNFSMDPLGDITTKNPDDLEDFDILFAGFPCQPFSIAGAQKGFEDARGTLFFDVCRFIRAKRPRYILLENVERLAKHDNGKTYTFILKCIDKLGYSVNSNLLIACPTQIGIPVKRRRIFIVAIRKDIYSDNFEIKLPQGIKIKSIFSYIGSQHTKTLKISNYQKNVIDMWNEFYQGIDLKVIGFPIWKDAFTQDCMDNIPDWKKRILLKNRLLYVRNKRFIDRWILKWDNLDWCNKTDKKFEWQAGHYCKDIYEGLIQFRPSGVRVARLKSFSTLVAMNHPQIIGKSLRTLSTREVAKLQGYKGILDENRRACLKQLGNSVNVDVVTYVIKEMLQVHHHQKNYG